MRIIGIDYGDVRTGVAISDETGLIARTLETIQHEGMEDCIQKTKLIIDEYGVETIVLGYPKNMNGTVGERGNLAKLFADKIKELCPVKTVLWDERLTTVSAHRTLSEANVRGKKRKKIIDSVAAVFILQGYLDSL